jgi:hypothetical protein
MLRLRAQGVSSPAARDQKKSTGNREPHLSTLLYIFPSSPLAPPFAHHFPPVPPAPLGCPRPRGADQSRSGFIQGQRGPWYHLSRPSTRPERGIHGPLVYSIARIAGQNQYNKLLGNVRITTVRSFRIVITCMVKYLKLEDVIISSSLLY